MQLPALLKSKQTAIVDRWTQLTLQIYPRDSAGFLIGEKDRFRNPIGHVTRKSLGILYDGLLSDRPAEEMNETLDGVVRIRAVQDVSPSQAVGFVLLLKHAIREELGEVETSEAQLFALYARIDRLCLQAFELYMSCREAIYDLRLRDSRRRLSALLDRIGGPAAEEKDVSATGGRHQEEEGGSGA